MKLYWLEFVVFNQIREILTRLFSQNYSIILNLYLFNSLKNTKIHEHQQNYKFFKGITFNIITQCQKYSFMLDSMEFVGSN